MVDVVFTGGRVVDVRTCTSRIANVAVEHGKIVDISAHELPAKRVVDAAGLVVAPGFIDVHGHLDGHAYAGQLSAMQGITTTVGGNCGLSPLDIEGWFAGQARTGYVINQAELVGHSFSMRRAVGIEDVNARASAAQTDAMVRIADRALRAGAAGVSLGLDYAPGSGLAEIDAMAAIAAEYGRCLPVHTRRAAAAEPFRLPVQRLRHAAPGAGRCGRRPRQGHGRMDGQRHVYRLGHLCRHRHL